MLDDDERLLQAIGPQLVDVICKNVEPEENLTQDQVLASKVFSVILDVYDAENMFEWTSDTIHLAHKLFRKGYYGPAVFAHVVDEILCY